MERGRILKNTALLGIAMVALGWWHRDAYPDPSRILPQLLEEPKQGPKGYDVPDPFEAVEGGVVYTITPLHVYHMSGMVVSERDTRVWWNYVHRDWGDFFNVKDICVLWGDNLRSGIYNEMDFSSGSFTCYCEMKDDHWEEWEFFRLDHISNNHLLPATPDVRAAILSTRRGDQVRLSGYLSEYSHSYGDFTRGTSTTRQDTGDGACETIYVTDYEILKAANRGWHHTYALGWFLIVGSIVLEVAGTFWDIRRRLRELEGIQPYDLGERQL